MAAAAAAASRTDKTCRSAAAESAKASGGKSPASARLWEAAKWLVLMSILPPLLNYSALQREFSALRPRPDQLFDVGFGQKLFMRCQVLGGGGDGGNTSSTGPTVIFDAPTGETSDAWAAVVRQLTATTAAAAPADDADAAATVCVFDRAGLGFSEMPPRFNMSDPGEAAVAKTLGPIASTLRMVQDLHRLVTFSAAPPPPFIMVGAELGALNALAFARIHPELVDHVVLIDPVAEPLFRQQGSSGGGNEEAWYSFWKSEQLPRLRLMEVTAALGLNRLGIITGALRTPARHAQAFGSASFAGDGDDQLLIRQNYLLSHPRHIGSAVEELANLNVSWNQEAKVGPDPIHRPSPA